MAELCTLVYADSSCRHLHGALSKCAWCVHTSRIPYVPGLLLNTTECKCRRSRSVYKLAIAVCQAVPTTKRAAYGVILPAALGTEAGPRPVLPLNRPAPSVTRSADCAIWRTRRRLRTGRGRRSTARWRRAAGALRFPSSYRQRRRRSCPTAP
jgi:hypothetical protein